MNKYNYYNQEAEQGVIRVLIENPDRLGEIELSEDDFVDMTYAKYYRVLREMFDSGEKITLPSVAIRVGEPSKLVDGWISSEYSSVIMLDTYVVIVKELSATRKLLFAVEEKKSIHELIELSKQLESQLIFKRMKNFDEVVELYEKDRERKRKQIEDGKGIGIITGFDRLDKKVCLERTHLDILAAKPSIGKSALALNIARGAAMFGQKVLFFSVEMRTESLMDRLCAMISGVSVNKFKHMTETASYPLAKLEFETLKKNLKLDYLPMGTSEDVCMLSRKEASRGQIDLIVVDYLQKLSDIRPKNGTNNDRVGEMSMRLKGLAGELTCCVLALSQVSRQADDVPELHHLRDSGNIEQDADLVLMLAREDRKSTVAQLVVKKAREGEAEIGISLKFDPETTIFSENIDNN